MMRGTPASGIWRAILVPLLSRPLPHPPPEHVEGFVIQASERPVHEQSSNPADYVVCLDRTVKPFEDKIAHGVGVNSLFDNGNYPLTDEYTAGGGLTA